jgi:hypothetical protein
VHSEDILIPIAGRRIVAQVATSGQVGAEPGPGVHILRVDLARFDPWFVAGTLAQNGNPHGVRRATGASGGTLRTDLKRLTIPVLALAEQQQYGQAFRQLAEFRAGLERAAAIGATLADDIGEGLATGTFAVREGQPAPRRR